MSQFNGMTSPVRSLLMRSSNPRSILRRPTALPMSPNPFPFHANFSVLITPSLKSPHVQFMASPQLVATYATHSSESYDRGPIAVSPNPLELPTRDDRYISPSLADFKLAAPPKPKASVQKRLDSIMKASQQCASPAITEFADPRSPKLQQPGMAPQLRFGSLVAPRDLSKAIPAFPRSPYLPAIEPSDQDRKMSETDRARSAEGTAPWQNKAYSRATVAFTPVPSPLQQTFKAPVTAGLQRSHRPAPLSLEPQDHAVALSDAFWDAVSLEVETPMVTALESFPSAVEMEDVDLKSPGFDLKSPGFDLKSPGVDPPALGLMFMFANQNGEVWSPTPVVSKQPLAREALLRSALMSPGKPASGRVKRSFIASPSPNDPFAAFPSFAAALSMAPSDPSIAYPARAVMAA